MILEKLLRERLKPVLARQRRLYELWGLAATWLAAALVGVAALALGPAGRGVWVALGAVAAVAIVGTMLTWRLARRAGPDERTVVRRIERRHPELRSLLLAAVEQRPREDERGRYGYMQERVIAEAVRHARSHRWVRAVPPVGMALAFLASAACFLLLVACAAMLARPLLSGGGAPGVADAAPSGSGVRVSPGDTAIERGAGVIITARFAGPPPDRAWLVIRSAPPSSPSSPSSPSGPALSLPPF